MDNVQLIQIQINHWIETVDSSKQEMIFNDKIESQSRPAIGWTTVATETGAEKLAAKLLEAKLVACAQVSGPVQSFYEWDNQVRSDREFRLTLKFPSDRADLIREFLKNHHDYEVPQWIWVYADGGSVDYLNWVLDLPEGNS